MILKEQIYTILFSTIYGSIFYILIILNKKLLFKGNIFKKIVFNLLFNIDLVLIYFIILRYINNGILTYYSYLFIIIGTIIAKYGLNKLKTYKK